MISKLFGSSMLLFELFPSVQDLLDTIQSFFYKNLITIDSIIYYSIDLCYQVFLALSRARIFSDDLFGEFIKRFYVLVGVLMLFFVVYTLLKAIVNPDEMTKGNSAPGKIIGKIVSSILMIALLPTAFNYLYQIQGVLLDNDLVGRIVLGGSSDSIQESVKKGGRQIAIGIFSAFFYPEDGKADSEITAEAEYGGKNYTLEEAKSSFVEEDVSFMVFTSFSKNAATEEIHYSWFISAIAGAFCLWVIANFVFDLGKRAVKLAVLQVIAPIPVLMRVIPNKEKTFNNWLSATAGTFFEVFVRVFIIYLIALIAGQINAIMDSMFSSVPQVAGPVRLATQAFLLLGVVAFAKQAPKMISDILGLKTGDMKLGLRDKLKDGGGFFAAGAIGAGVTSFVQNGYNAAKNIKQAKGARGKVGATFRGAGSMIAGGAAGALRGGIAGNKAKTFGELATNTSGAIQTTVDKRAKRESYREEHPGTFGVTRGHVKDTAKTVARWATGETSQALQARRDAINTAKEQYNSVFSAIKKDVEENEEKYVINIGGKYHVLSNLHGEWDAAKKNAESIKRSDYADDQAYEDAKKQAQVAEYNARTRYIKARDDIVANQNQFERGDSAHSASYKYENLKLEADGTVDVSTMIEANAKHIANIDVSINQADQIIQKNRAEIVKLANDLLEEKRTELRKKLSAGQINQTQYNDQIKTFEDDEKLIRKALDNPTGVVDRKVRNAIGNIVNKMDIDIAKRRKDEKKDKK